MKWFTKETEYAPFYLVVLRAAGMCLGLAFLSFFSIAGVATMIAVLVYSVWCYVRPSSVEGAQGFKGYFSPRYLQGILPGLIATTILQLVYFISGSDLFPFTVALVLFIANLFLYVVISFIGVGIGEIILWSSKSKKKSISKASEEKRKKLATQFDNRLKQLTVFILLVYVQMHVVLPVTSLVHASENLTVDEFIETYDPENNYEISTETVDENVTQKMPVDGVILQQEGGVTAPGGEETAKEQFIREEKKKMDAAEQKKMQELKKQKLSLEQLESKLKDGEITLSQFITLSWEGVTNGSISFKSVYDYVQKKLTEVGIDGEVQGALRDYLFSFGNPIAFARLVHLVNKKTDGGLVHGTQEFIKRVGEKLVEAATWIKENPKEAAIGAVLVIGVVVLTVVCPPAGAVVALALTGIGVGLTGVTLYDAYHKDGWDGVRREIISDEAVSMWNAGDYAGAIGRGSVDASVFVLMNLPSVGAAQVGKVVQVKSAITGLTKIRGSISVAIEGGELSVKGAQIIRGVFKGVSDDAELMTHVTLLLADPKSSFAILLNKQSAAALNGKGAAQTKVITIAKDSLIIDAKNSFTKLPPEFKIWLKDIKRTNSSYGIKADTSRFAEYVIQHLIEGNINDRYKVIGFHHETLGKAGKIIPETIEYHPLSNGVYRAKVNVWGFAKKSNQGYSTFFPKNWSSTDVVDAINYVYKNRKFIRDNIYSGEYRGVNIEIALDKNGKISTAYPSWQK